MQIKKVRGGKITTKVVNENIIDREVGLNRRLTDVSVVNLGTEEIHLIINDGDEIPLESGETLNLGELVVDTILVKEINSIVKYIGVE